MPYQVYGNTEVSSLVTKFTEAQAKVKANKNPLKSGELKKALDTLGQQRVRNPQIEMRRFCGHGHNWQRQDPFFDRDLNNFRLLFDL